MGLGLDGKATVGFLLGAFKDGIVEVAPPVGCRHVSLVAQNLAGAFQEFLRTQSNLPVWDKRQNAGALILGRVV